MKNFDAAPAKKNFPHISAYWTSVDEDATTFDALLRPFFALKTESSNIGVPHKQVKGQVAKGEGRFSCEPFKNNHTKRCMQNFFDKR